MVQVGIDFTPKIEGRWTAGYHERLYNLTDDAIRGEPTKPARPAAKLAIFSWFNAVLCNLSIILTMNVVSRSLSR